MTKSLSTARPNIMKNGTPLFCDLYHLTMAQSWFLDGKALEPKTSEAFFRKLPNNFGYLMSAGLGEFIQWLNNWHFNKEDIDYLRTVETPDGYPMFQEEFLNFLQGQKLSINLKAVPEGEIIFPNEPVYSVSGPTWQVDLIEAALLNAFNSQSPIATKASRMVYASSLDGKKRPLLEFGLRRGREYGGFSETRAAIVGGASSTSNVAAAKYYGIKSAGTMAHSYIMSYENEVDAFKAFMRANPHNTTLLIDTYDTRQGALNAIKASQETGIKLMGVRIDSGDLAYWGKEVRQILDDAGMTDTKLIASNDLDDNLIEHLIMVQKAPYDTLAVGTKLVDPDLPALGGVFKTKSYNGQPRIKIAQGKTTIPNATDVIRVVKDGKFEGDIICSQSDTNILSDGKLVKPITSYSIADTNKSKRVFNAGETAYSLLQDFVIDGQIVLESELDLYALQKRGEQNLQKLDDCYKRLQNPHIYGVGLEANLYNLQQNLIMQHLGR